MTTSGTTTWNPAAEFVIQAAFQVCGIINEDEIPTEGQFKLAMYALNSLMKELMASGIHVWTEEEGIIFLNQYQRTYFLGTGQAGSRTPDKACSALSWTQTNAFQAYNTGATSIQLNSVSGLNPTDNIGFYLNTNGSYWTTISSIAGNIVTIPGPGLPSPISPNALVWSYPVAAQILRPLRIPYARRLQYAAAPVVGTPVAPDWGGIITPLTPMNSRQDFMNLPQPNNPGLVTQVFYDPARDQGQFWVWNVSINAGYAMRFTYYRPLQDFNSQADTADLPQEWNNALTWMLAKELAPRYSVPQVRFDRITAEAAAKYALVQGWDREPESVYFGRSSPQGRG